MTTDTRKPTGIRITSSSDDGKITTLFLNRTAKCGPNQNDEHTIIQPMHATIISDLSATEIGNAVRELLDMD